MKDSIVKIDASMRKLLEAINASPPAGIAFVVDDNFKLVSVVTDGDFRRWLLQGFNLDDHLSKINLEKCVYAKKGEPLDKVLTRTNEKIRFIPIVDEKHRVVDYLQIDKRVHVPVAIPDLYNGNELKYITDAFLSSWISSQGAYLNRFEEDFSKYCSMKFGVSTSNGTAAIHLALRALNIGPGDEVILPDLTFAATINAVIHAGATPVLVDVDLLDWCISTIEIKKAITNKTKAIISVHLYGQPCNMDKIQEICKEENIFLIEDAAEAHGAEYKTQKVGSFGDISCFSFFANKIITTGEGGICLTNSEELKNRMEVLRDHGMNKSKRYWHDEVGFNYRMTNIQAAIGCAQLERINEILNIRKDIEQSYLSVLGSSNALSFQKDIPDRKKSIWLVSALYEGKNRANFIKKMNNEGLDIRPFFYPLSTMPIYKKFTFSNKASVSIASKGVNFPTHWDVEQNSILKIRKLLHELT